MGGHVASPPGPRSEPRRRDRRIVLDARARDNSYGGLDLMYLPVPDGTTLMRSGVITASLWVVVTVVSRWWPW
jgi:hypothetical protein